MNARTEVRRALARGRSNIAARVGRLPIRLRLALSFAGVMIVLFGAIALLLYFRFEAGLDAGIRNSLVSRTAVLKTFVETTKLGIPPPLGSGTSDGDFAQILSPTGQVLYGTQNYGPAPHSHPVVLLSRTHLEAALRSPQLITEGNRARLLAEPLTKPRSEILVVGISLAQRNGALNTLGELLFVGGPIALLLACAAGYLLAERVLAPVERMRRRAEGISGKRPGARLPVPNTRDELQRLGETLNEMLARLDAAVERERVLVALASHELRTPLSIIKLELELALDPRRSRSELKEALQSVIEEVDRLTRLAQDMLMLARAARDGLPLVRQRVDVGELLRATASRIRRANGGETGELVVDADRGLFVQGDRDRLQRAVANMADNAVRHGRAPVVLRAARTNGAVELHVSDRGPGFPAAFLPHAFERFSRADASSPSGGGTGLGLAIVRAVAEAHGGSADAENAAHGGAHVWLRIPAQLEPKSATALRGGD